MPSFIPNVVNCIQMDLHGWHVQMIMIKYEQWQIVMGYDELKVFFGLVGIEPTYFYFFLSEGLNSLREDKLFIVLSPLS